MIRDYYEHWPLIPSQQNLSEDEAAKLLEEIRARAQSIHDELVKEGRFQSPQDDWLAAEAEVLRDRGFPPHWRVLSPGGRPLGDKRGHHGDTH